MYLTVGLPPTIRIMNEIKPLNNKKLEAEDLQKLVNCLLDEDKKDELEATLELNTAMVEDNGSRFRLNFFYQQNNLGLVIRKINTDIPTAESLHLPRIYTDIIMRKHGLIIMASPAGSGKSTSMAAMINHRNEHSCGHIITIEDPIEFVHEHKKCIITQREVGSDTFTYEMALKNVLRQRADVVVIGEIRDRESMDYAMRFSETGHLCIATLHANNTSQAVERMTNFFPEDVKLHILAELSQVLVGIISQKLVTNVRGSQSLAMEILLNEGLVRNLINENRIKEISESLCRNFDAGMQTMDQSLLGLYDKGEIDLSEALNEAESPSNLKLMVNQKGMNKRERRNISTLNL